MEVSAEAKRIMVVALGKLYGSRTQRGGLRLHRSLLLTLVMKSARDIYHAAQAAAEPGGEQQQQTVAAEPVGAPDLRASPPCRTLPEEEVARASTETRKGAEDKENRCTAAQHTRKRRGKAAAEPDFLPRKKAKLEPRSCPQPAPVVNSVYGKCGSELGGAIPLHRAVAAC